MAKQLFGSSSSRAGLACTVYEGEVFIFGGHNGEMPVKSAEAFRPSEDPEERGEWVSLPPMLARRAYLTVNVMGAKIYALGGSADGRTLNTFEVFNTENFQWEQWFSKPPMSTKRTVHASAVADNKLYVTGGFDGIRDLNSVEVYDPRTNTWSSSIDNMHKCRSYHALVTAAGSIYAIGGQERVSKGKEPRAHCSVEAFELYCERWLPVPDMSTGRIGPSAAVIIDDEDNEFIYVTGGSDGEQVLRSCEVLNSKEGTWELIEPMTHPRLSHTSAVVDGKIYVLGGFDGKVALDTYECYDPATKSWSPPMPMGVREEKVEAPAIAFSVSVS